MARGGNQIFFAKVKKTGEIIRICPIMGKDCFLYVKPGIKDPYQYHPEELEFIKNKEI